MHVLVQSLVFCINETNRSVRSNAWVRTSYACFFKETINIRKGRGPIFIVFRYFNSEAVHSLLLGFTWRQLPFSNPICDLTKNHFGILVFLFELPIGENNSTEPFYALNFSPIEIQKVGNRNSALRLPFIYCYRVLGNTKIFVSLVGYHRYWPKALM